MDKTKSTVSKVNPKPVNVFFVWYSELCRRLNLQPSSAIKPAKAKCQTILDFVADRIKVEEWAPIANAIKLDTSLHVIAVRNRIGNCQFLHDIDTEEKVKHSKRKFGTIWTAFVLKQLLKSISCTLKTTEVLSYLELDGLPMFMQYLEPLMQSLKKNTTLKTLSLTNSNIQDAGCQMVCSYLRFIPNIEIVNFSGCSLSAISGEHVAKLIKYQQINRYCESWHNSLRYENPDCGKMRGIKRITINSNPFFGDVGLAFILNELEDDLWIKALDLQKCGLTENISNKIFEIIQRNNILEIFDTRQNDALTISTIEKVFQLLKERQKDGSQPEYQWCNTAISLMYYNVGSAVCSTLSKSTISANNNVHKTRSAPIKKPSTRGDTPGCDHALRKIRTVDSIPKNVSNNSLKESRKQVLELNEKLQKEIQKRKEVEKLNAALQSQLTQIQTVTQLCPKKSTRITPKNGVKSIHIQRQEQIHKPIKKYEEALDLQHQKPLVIRRKGGSNKIDNHKETTKQLMIKNGLQNNGVRNGITNGLSNAVLNGISSLKHTNGFSKIQSKSGAYNIFEKIVRQTSVTDNQLDSDLLQYFTKNIMSNKNKSNLTNRKEKEAAENFDSSSQVSLYQYMEELKHDKT